MYKKHHFLYILVVFTILHLYNTTSPIHLFAYMYYCCNVKQTTIAILNIRTGMANSVDLDQTVLKEQPDQGLLCLSATINITNVFSHSQRVNKPVQILFG